MAAGWEITNTSHAEELVGGTRVQPVTEVGFTTSPSNVYVQVRIPIANAGPGVIAALLDYYAPLIEDLAQSPYVAGVVYVQDVNAAGQLIDELDVTVQLPGTDLTGQVSGPLAWLSPPEPGSPTQRSFDVLVQDELARLRALQAA